MKRIIVICLAVMLLCSNALAATWADGLGPQKPYSGTPEVDFNETIGYMLFYPVNGSNVIAGNDEISIYLPREDVETSEGTFYLYSKEENLVEEIVINAETMVARPMTEEELEATMWGCGTAFTVKLSQPTVENRHYIVQLTEGCIVSTEYEAVSPAIAGEDAWTFNTETDNDIKSITYTRVVEGEEKPAVVEDVQVGDSATISIVMGEETAYAVIFCDEGIILPEANYFTESGDTVVRVPANGTVAWGIAYFDAENNMIYVSDIVTEVKAAE